MGIVEDLSAKADALTALVANVGGDVTALKAEIQALKDIIAGGGTITEAQLQPVMDKLTALEGQLTSLDQQTP